MSLNDNSEIQFTKEEDAKYLYKMHKWLLNNFANENLPYQGVMGQWWTWQNNLTEALGKCTDFNIWRVFTSVQEVQSASFRKDHQTAQITKEILLPSFVFQKQLLISRVID